MSREVEVRVRKSGQDTSDGGPKGLLRGGKIHKLLFAVLILLLPSQLGKHWWPQWSYVLGLRLDYLSPTIYLTDLLAVGVLGLWSIEKIYCNTPHATRNTKKNLANLLLVTCYWLRKYWWILAIFLFLFLNCLFAQNSGAAFYKLAKIIEFTLFGFYIAKNRYQLSAISYQLSLGVICSSLIAITQFLKQSSLNGIFYWLGERTFDISTPGIAKAIVGGRLLMRPYAAFPHPNVLAGFILIGLILTFPFLFKKNKLSAISYQLLAIITLLISFSRSTWLVGLAVGLWWLMSCFKTSKVELANQDYNDEEKDARRPPRTVAKQRRLQGEKSKITSILNLVALANQGYKTREKTRGVHLRGEIRRKKLLLVTYYLLLVTGFGFLLLFKFPFSSSEAVSQRLQLAKAVVAMIKESPFIGVGLNNFLVRLPEFWQAPENIRLLQPVHNIFLLVAAETGLVGLLIFAWFLILTFRHLRGGRMDSSKVERKDKFPLALALSAILLLGLTDHYFLTLQQTQLLLTIVFGLCYTQEQGDI